MADPDEYFLSVSIFVLLCMSHSPPMRLYSFGSCLMFTWSSPSSHANQPPALRCVFCFHWGMAGGRLQAALLYCPIVTPRRLWPVLHSSLTEDTAIDTLWLLLQVTERPECVNAYCAVLFNNRLADPHYQTTYCQQTGSFNCLPFYYKSIFRKIEVHSAICLAMKNWMQMVRATVISPPGYPNKKRDSENDKAHRVLPLTLLEQK